MNLESSPTDPPPWPFRESDAHLSSNSSASGVFKSSAILCATSCMTPSVGAHSMRDSADLKLATRYTDLLRVSSLHILSSEYLSDRRAWRRVIGSVP